MLIITHLVHFLSSYLSGAHGDLIILPENEAGQVDDYKSAVRHSRDDSRMPTWRGSRNYTRFVCEGAAR